MKRLAIYAFLCASPSVASGQLTVNPTPRAERLTSDPRAFDAGRAQTDPRLQGISDVEVLVSLEDFAPAIRSMVSSRVKVVADSPNAVVVNIHIHRGGMVDYHQIFFGNVSVQVFRPARVLLDPRSSSPTLGGIVPVSVVYHSKAFYSDNGGVGLEEHISRMASELIGRLRF